MSFLTRIGLSAASSQILCTNHLSSAIVLKRWKYRGVIFDMGGVILPSPFPIAKGNS